MYFHFLHQISQTCCQAVPKQPLSKGYVRCVVFGGNVNNITFSLVAIIIILDKNVMNDYPSTILLAWIEVCTE